MTYLGSASPDFTGGLNINLSYKNIDMVVFLNGSYGNEIVNAMYQSLYSSRMFETNISRDMALNHWTPERPDSNVPRLTAGDPNKNDERFSDRWVEDGSYLRIKNIQLGYSLPKTLINKVHIQTCEFMLRSITSLPSPITLVWILNCLACMVTHSTMVSTW
ncbi:MAG: hypothetical protein HC905_02275 [Bacteroidales bacterium]|nr:hypothetical protein [Bacteroidales bacterium]